MLGWVVFAAQGGLQRVLDLVDDELVPYLLRYSSLSVRDIDALPIRRLRKIADGIGKIIEQENKA